MINYLGIWIDTNKDNQLEGYSKEMLASFYMLGHETSPQHAFARAAVAWSTYRGRTNFSMAQRLYDAVSNKWFMYASPVLSNAWEHGVKIRGLPISCFLSFVPDSIDGLIDHSSEERRLSVMGGGVGGHWSAVRTISDIAPGPIPFIHTVDADMEAYKQGDTRKGSYAAYLSIDHPDIEEFINIRVPTGDVNRKAFAIHNAVNITDDFMQKVINGEDYELIDPKLGPTGEFRNARRMFERLLEIRFRTGEPYLNFIDTANAALPEVQKKLGLKIHGSNLCNEIHLATDETRTAVCCLSSLNLEYYDEWKNTDLVKDLIRMLDNVLEYFIENAPPSLHKAVHSARSERALGLGQMGLHNLLQSKNLVYGSKEALALDDEISKFIKAEAVEESKALAILRGEPDDMRGTGLRNSHLLAIAPNASSALLLATSPSTEQNKANAYVHRTRGGSFLIKNPYLKATLKKYGKDNDDTWLSIVTNKGSVQHLDFLTNHEKLVFLCAAETDQHRVIDHAATRQKHICQGQSVNLFFYPGVQRSHVKDVHIYAWKKGLKGLYYLRTESKQRADNISKGVELNKLVDAHGTVIYGKPGCPQCSMAKSLMESRGIEFEYVDILAKYPGKTAAEITGRPDVRSLPQIYLDGDYIGGFDALYKFFKDADAAVEEEEEDTQASNTAILANAPQLDMDTCVSCSG